ncbi:hypothetical protein EVAR_21287_1 [Eumeta japonica]|uniref:Uncharacterized protein n=1 Tax=Eumeta variegata TaxID=151549 RepID=A0A4C1WL25_EUMVA|nr:hypothetical protein EVAR_21287_1 [Eumeta japonica]
MILILRKSKFKISATYLTGVTLTEPRLRVSLSLDCDCAQRRRASRRPPRPGPARTRTTAAPRPPSGTEYTFKTRVYMSENTMEHHESRGRDYRGVDLYVCIVEPAIPDTRAGVESRVHGCGCRHGVASKMICGGETEGDKDHGPVYKMVTTAPRMTTAAFINVEHCIHYRRRSPQASLIL